MVEETADKTVFQLQGNIPLVSISLTYSGAHILACLVVSGRKLFDQSNRTPDVSVKVKVNSFFARTLIERSLAPVWNETFKL